MMSMRARFRVLLHVMHIPHMIERELAIWARGATTRKRLCKLLVRCAVRTLSLVQAFNPYLLIQLGAQFRDVELAIGIAINRVKQGNHLLQLHVAVWYCTSHRAVQQD